MNENNMNQTPQTPNQPNGYPQSGYPQSGYPQSQQPFPQSGMPYPMSGYGEEKKSKTWQIAIIAIVAVLIIALATTLIVVMRNRNGQMQPPPQPMMGTMISISESGSMINGQPASIGFFTENGKAYLKIEDISSTAGYDFVREGDQVKLLSQMELAIMELGSTEVTIQDQTSKATTTVEILKAPFEKDGDVYIYARDLSVFMKNTNVSYNSMTGSVEISIGSGGQPPMGGPGGQPQMGAQAPMGEQPQNGAPAEQDAKTAAENAAPQGEQAPQGGQPPQDGQAPKK